MTSQSDQPDNPFAPPARLDGLDFGAYSLINAANYSRLKTLLDRSPAHALADRREPSKAMTLGTMIHTAVLEPRQFAKDYVVRPDIKTTTNAGKADYVAWLAEVLCCKQPDVPKTSAQGKKLADGVMLDMQIGLLEQALADKGLSQISEAQNTTAARVREAVQSHPIVGPLIADADAEVTYLAIDPATGVLVKVRADAVCRGHDLILDIKTAEDASFEAFSKAAGRYRYHLQAALYRWVYRLVCERAPGFLHVVLETTPPYGVAVYDLDEEAIQHGEQRMRAGLSRWAECERSGAWPGYTPEIVSLSLPRWSL
jgi:hypothetical protein